MLKKLFPVFVFAALFSGCSGGNGHAAASLGVFSPATLLVFAGIACSALVWHFATASLTARWPRTMPVVILVAWIIHVILVTVALADAVGLFARIG